MMEEEKEIFTRQLSVVDSFLARRKNLILPGFDQEIIIDKVRKRLEGIKAVFGGDCLEGAIFNQNFSYDLYQKMMEVQRGRGKSLVQREIEMFVELLEELYKQNVPQKDLIHQVLCGAKAQAGLMFTLSKNGFWVIPPRTEEEIKKMDLHGVDFAAVNPQGVLFLIEVKSLYKTLHGGRPTENRSVRVQPISLTARTIAETLSLISRRGEHSYQKNLFSGRIRYVAFKIAVPTGGNSMDRYGRIVPKIEKLILNEFEKAKVKVWAG